jgi:hypothetical protein
MMTMYILMMTIYIMNPLKTKVDLHTLNIEFDFVRHREHCASFRRTSSLILYSETYVVYCKKNAGHINRMRVGIMHSLC